MRGVGVFVGFEVGREVAKLTGAPEDLLIGEFVFVSVGASVELEGVTVGVLVLGALVGTCVGANVGGVLTLGQFPLPVYSFKLMGAAKSSNKRLELFVLCVNTRRAGDTGRQTPNASSSWSLFAQTQVSIPLFFPGSFVVPKGHGAHFGVTP